MEHIIVNQETGVRLTLYWKPGSEPSPMVIICPGGAYRWLSDREQKPVAKVFNQMGMQAAVLEYRVGSDLGYGPMYDLAWAVRTVRENAEQFGTDRGKIVVCGFSAGGHVAGMLGVNWNHAGLFPDPEERSACRPDGLILCYPMVSCDISASGSGFRQICDDVGRWKEYSVEKLVSADVPPVFLWHTATDLEVPVESSLLLAGKLTQAGVSCEFHIFPRGVHGLSIATKEVEDLSKGRRADPYVARWTEWCGSWIRAL